MSPGAALDVLPRPVRQTLLVLGALAGLAAGVVAGYGKAEAWVETKAHAAAQSAVAVLADRMVSLHADVREVKREVRATRRAVAAHVRNDPALMLADDLTLDGPTAPGR